MPTSVVPDLRHADPAREVLSNDNVVMDDIVAHLVSLSESLTRYEDSGLVSHGNVTLRKVDELNKVVSMFRKRLTGAKAEVLAEVRRRKSNGTM